MFAHRQRETAALHSSDRQNSPSLGLEAGLGLHGKDSGLVIGSAALSTTMPHAHHVPFGAASFVFDTDGDEPTKIDFRYPALSMALLERGQRLRGDVWNTSGIYFLVGPGQAAGSSRIYVGKSPAGVATRIVQHEASKDWWDRAVVVVANRRDGFTSAEVGWLEAAFVTRLRESIGESVANKTQPSDNTLPSYMIPELQAQIHPIEAVLRLLGVLTVAVEPEIIEEREEPASVVGDSTQGGRPVMTWLEAATAVLPEDGTSLHVHEIIDRITVQGLRDMTNARTPEATARRDLRKASSDPSSAVVQTAPSTFARRT